MLTNRVAIRGTQKIRIRFAEEIALRGTHPGRTERERRSERASDFRHVVMRKKLQPLRARCTSHAPEPASWGLCWQRDTAGAGVRVMEFGLATRWGSVSCHSACARASRGGTATNGRTLRRVNLARNARARRGVPIRRCYEEVTWPSNATTDSSSAKPNAKSLHPRLRMGPLLSACPRMMLCNTNLYATALDQVCARNRIPIVHYAMLSRLRLIGRNHMHCVHPQIASLTSLCAVAITLSFPAFGAGPSDIPNLEPGARVPEMCTLSGQPIASTIGARGANGTGFFTPSRVEFIMDVAVEDGKEVMLTILDDEQYKAVSAGRRPDGQPPLKVMLSDVDSASVVLPRGNYFVAFNNRTNTPTRMWYRCSTLDR